MKVGFASMDWSKTEWVDGKPVPGGSGWYRMHLPYLALKEHGVDTVIGRLVFHTKAGVLGVQEWESAGMGGAVHLDCGVIVLQRWMHRDLADDIKAARSRGQIVVQDVDDWFWGLASQNVASRSLIADPDHNIQHYRKVLAASDLIIASTPYLAQRLKSFLGDKVTVVKNCIDLHRWPNRTLQRERPVLGWAGATPWRSGDLETVRGTIPALCQRFGVTFHHSGHLAGSQWPSAGEVLGIPEERRSESPMVPVAVWPDQFRHMDVGIVPLSDRPFNHAKSCIKGMEYAAAGVPFVAQATPEYLWLYETHGIGRIVRKPREWTRQLETLLRMPPEERAHEAAVNRELVAALSTDHLAKKWLAALVERVKAA